MPLRECYHPGCRTLTRGTYCPQHEALHGSRGGRDRDRLRGNSAARGYGSRHRRLRDALLRDHPFCQWPNCNALATVRDHVVPLSEGGSDEPSNTQALCEEHHAEKTQCDIERRNVAMDKEREV